MYCNYIMNISKCFIIKTHINSIKYIELIDNQFNV